MMVTTLSKLVEMTQGGAVPAWLRTFVLDKKDDIVTALRRDGEYTFDGPNGERVTIKAEKEASVAA